MAYEIVIQVGDKSVTRLKAEKIEDCDVLENFPLDPQSVETFVSGGRTYINGFDDAVLTIKMAS